VKPRALLFISGMKAERITSALREIVISGSMTRRRSGCAIVRTGIGKALRKSRKWIVVISGNFADVWATSIWREKQMQKTVNDETIGEPVPIKEFYESNPTCMRLTASFELKCKKCKSKYLTVGLSAIKLSKEDLPAFYCFLSCLNCGARADSVYLVLEDGKWRMANEQRKYS